MKGNDKWDCMEKIAEWQIIRKITLNKKSKKFDFR